MWLLICSYCLLIQKQGVGTNFEQLCSFLIISALARTRKLDLLDSQAVVMIEFLMVAYSEAQ